MRIRENIYNSMPIAVKKMASYVPKRILFGTSFPKWLQFINKSEMWPKHKIEEYQIYKLRELANIAYYTTDFWRNLFDKYEIKPESFDFEVLQKLPVIDSQIVKNNFQDMISKKFKKKGYIVSTGGTGKRPTPIFLSNESFAIEWAFMYNQWQRIGYRWSEKKATFRGKNIGEKLWQFNPVYNEILFNVFKISNETALKMFEHIYSEGITYFHGYLSAIYIFGKHLETLNVNGNKLKLKGILLGSENIVKEKREFLESFFGCRCYSWYGQSEKVILAGECEYSQDYHNFFQYGFTEILDDQNNPKRTGRLVGTSFVNEAMPLIRYDTGDLGCIEDSFCDKCQRSYQRLLGVSGRWSQDFVYDFNNNPVPTAAVNIHLEDQQEILNLQIHQYEVGKIILLVSFQNDVEKKYEIMQRIQKEFQDKLGRDFNVEIKDVADKEITRSKIGKVPYLVQSIKHLSTGKK